MKIDFNKPVEQFFFAPGTDPGLSLTDWPKWLWRARPGANITGHAVGSYPDQRHEVEKHIFNYGRFRQFGEVVEVNCVPAVVEDALFTHSFASIKGRWFLNGAAGTRLRNRYAWKNEGSDEAVTAHFERIAETNPTLPPLTAHAWQDLPAVLECRNFFNYYHFTTETLCQLTTLCDIGHRGPVHIHAPVGKAAGFPLAFIETLFPELGGRVSLVQENRRYPRALTSWSMRHYLHHAPPHLMDPLEPMGPPSWLWQGRKANRGSQAILAMNGYDAALRRLNERAHRIVADHDASHLPRRFWITRDTTGPRKRAMKGEARMKKALRDFGFRAISFESLTPMEQISLVANAEMMAGYHGAGFANMLYAKPHTHVLEMGTWQTAIHRWADFMPHAHAAGCHYASFFADFNKNKPEEAPEITSEGLLPVAISDAGIETVCTHIQRVVSGPHFTGQEARVASRVAAADLAGNTALVDDLLARHPELTPQSPEMLVATANRAGHRADYPAAYKNLAAAYRLVPARPLILERLIALAIVIDRPRDLDVLIERHRAQFPDRSAEREAAAARKGARPAPGVPPGPSAGSTAADP